MGYSHYWYTEPSFPPAEFRKVASDFKRLVKPLEHLGVKLANGVGGKFPQFTANEIRFNGPAACGHKEQSLRLTWPSENASGVMVGGDGPSSQWFAGDEIDTRMCDGDCSHETFLLQRKSSGHVTERDGRQFHFNCCKTAYKPYDLAVNACLIVAKHHLGDGMLVSSDGEAKDWKDGMWLCDHFLGYGSDFTLFRGD